MDAPWFALQLLLKNCKKHVPMAYMCFGSIYVRWPSNMLVLRASCFMMLSIPWAHAWKP